MQASDSQHNQPSMQDEERERIDMRPETVKEPRFALREQMLTISSGDRTRIVRLGAKSQVVILSAAAILVTWIVAATSIAVVSIVRPATDSAGRQFQTDLAERVIQLESESEKLLKSNARYQDWSETLFDFAFDQSVELAELRKHIIEYERVTAARDAAASSRSAFVGDYLIPADGPPDQEASAESIAERRMETLFDAVDGTVESLEAARNEIQDLAEENTRLRENADLRQRQSEQVVSEILDVVVAVSTDLEQIFQSAGVSIDDLEDATKEAYRGQGGPSEPIPADLDTSGIFPRGTGIDSLIDLANQLHTYRVYYRGTPFGRPVHARHNFTSGYGMRTHPVTGRFQMHKGIDLAAPPGTPILATGDGTVTFAGRSGNYGLLIRVEHLGGISTTYAHLEKIYVRKGQSVSRNQQIGAMGSTGASTGPHLHYEIVVDGKMINPMKFIEARANVYQQE